MPNDLCVEEVDDEDERWIDVPHGDYRVTVHAIDWSSEPDSTNEDGYGLPDSLPSYVFAFSRVNDIREIPLTVRVAPTLAPGKWGRTSDWAEDETFQEQELTEHTFVLHETPNWMIVPGFSDSLPVSDAMYEAIHGTEGCEILPDPIRTFVLCAPSVHAGDVGVVTEAGGGSRSSWDPAWHIGFRSVRLVRLLERINAVPWPKVRVKPVDRGSPQVREDQLEQLKSVFARYGARSAAFRANVRNPDFKIERLQSLITAEGVLHFLLQYVQLTTAEKTRLLFASDQERAQALLAIMGDTA